MLTKTMSSNVTFSNLMKRELKVNTSSGLTSATSTAPESHEKRVERTYIDERVKNISKMNLMKRELKVILLPPLV